MLNFYYRQAASEMSFEIVDATGWGIFKCWLHHGGLISLLLFLLAVIFYGEKKAFLLPGLIFSTQHYLLSVLE